MLVSQKDQYALRAVFELAKHYGRGPLKVADIADAQNIPPRFLEVILSELKQAEFLDSRRGQHGGYLLLLPPAELTVGDVINVLQGPIRVAARQPGPGSRPKREDGVLLPLWRKIENAISGICQSISFADLVEQEKLKVGMRVPTYAI